jgi:integrase
MKVEPIRDLKKIKKLQDHLKLNSKRDLLLLNFGLNTGLRISDLLKIKVCDIWTKNKRFKHHFSLTEGKTSKTKKIKLNDALKKYLKQYLKSVKPKYQDYIFKSRKGTNRPISRVQAYRFLKQSSDKVGIQNFGTHSLRKTWGYWTYKKSKYNIALIMDMFNHSSQKITLEYIGISQDQKDELYSIVQF